MANGAVASLAAKEATSTIPIVSITGDPVRIGLVGSMSRPGGNITGTSTVAPELAAKRLELLRELLPTTKRVGELVDPANPYMKSFGQRTSERTARSECSRFCRRGRGFAVGESYWRTSPA
jgi:putative ABC transport system substrate-binding protein